MLLITIYFRISSWIMNEVACPKCGRIPRFSEVVGQAFLAHVCFASCGYQFWTLRICPYCPHPQRTILLDKPNFGQKIRCTNCNHCMFYFLCPNKNCTELFYKDQHFYKVGNCVSCMSCGLTYKTVPCLCGGQTLLQPQQIVLQGFKPFKCGCCGRDFTVTVCPSCLSPQYHVDKLEIGDRIRCSACKLWRKYVPCPKCGKTLRGQRFSFCQPVQCDECLAVFEYSKCPFGCSGINFMFLEKKLGPIRRCFQCDRGYSVVNCKKCQNSLYLENIDKSIGVIDYCPHCKDGLKYYLCGNCGQFNDQDTSCINKKCPPTKVFADNTKLKKLPQKQNEGSKNPDEQCKICYSAKVQVINQTCSHLMMCQTCLRQIQMKHRGAMNIPCPVCKQIGRYFKYRKPIYS